MIQHGRVLWPAIISGILVLSCASQSQNNPFEEVKWFDLQKVIYGEDDRTEVYASVNPTYASWADSTVALMKSRELESQDDQTYRINALTFGEEFNLCENEPFREQKSAAFCSGSLIGKDLILTAGHCVETQSECEDTLFVFGFSIKNANDDASTVLKTDVYSCKELVVQHLEGYGPDYAVIRLDREVSGHAPLSVRKNGVQAEVGTPLVVIGHPSGLPTKVAAGASVRAQHDGYFSANLDTYGGNSGSAVFNANTGEIEGILVRGERDFVSEGGCTVSNRCPDNGCGGEHATQISEVLPWIPDGEEVEPTPEPSTWSAFPQVSIPDSDDQGVSSSVEVNEVPDGRKVQVRVDIAHPYQGDLSIRITAPNGQSVLLKKESTGGSEDHVRGIFGADLTSEESLDAFSGVNQQGTWTIQVIDHYSQDAGALRSWDVRFR